MHQRAVESLGGSCSVLFEDNSRNGALQATSAWGLEQLQPEPWRPGAIDGVIVNGAFSSRSPTLVADVDEQMPELSARINTSAAVLLPLFSGSERSGLLIVGFKTASTADLSKDIELAEIAGVFLLALELFRLRRRDALQRDFRELFEEFSTALASTLDLQKGLDTICDRVNRLFGADRTSVWIHDRALRHLTLEASTDVAPMARGLRISAEDMRAPAAAAMRRPRAEIMPASDEAVTSVITIPLRGTRRALGTVVLEGVRIVQRHRERPPPGGSD
jgi:transcriptional regulator with GAF, ATPase, and Fis domain